MIQLRSFVNGTFSKRYGIPSQRISTRRVTKAFSALQELWMNPPDKVYSCIFMINRFNPDVFKRIIIFTSDDKTAEANRAPGELPFGLFHRGGVGRSSAWLATSFSCLNCHFVGPFLPEKIRF